MSPRGQLKLRSLAQELRQHPSSRLQDPALFGSKSKTFSSCCEVSAWLPSLAFPSVTPLWLTGEPFPSLHGSFPPTSLPLLCSAQSFLQGCVLVDFQDSSPFVSHWVCLAQDPQCRGHWRYTIRLTGIKLQHSFLAFLYQVYC